MLKTYTLAFRRCKLTRWGGDFSRLSASIAKLRRSRRLDPFNTGVFFGGF